VNRGWVPRNKTNPKTRQEAQVVYTLLVFESLDVFYCQHQTALL